MSGTSSPHKPQPSPSDALDIATAVAGEVRSAPSEREAVAVIMKRLFDCRPAHCAHCGDEWWTGTRTGRRSHGKYCSDRCRVASMRERNRVPEQSS